LVLQYENKIVNGSYVFVAKVDIFERDYQQLIQDFRYCMKKLEVLV